jgi:hypothetical protein
MAVDASSFGRISKKQWDIVETFADEHSSRVYSAMQSFVEKLNNPINETVNKLLTIPMLEQSIDIIHALYEHNIIPNNFNFAEHIASKINNDNIINYLCKRGVITDKNKFKKHIKLVVDEEKARDTINTQERDQFDKLFNPDYIINKHKKSNKTSKYEKIKQTNTYDRFLKEVDKMHKLIYSQSKKHNICFSNLLEIRLIGLFMLIIKLCNSMDKQRTSKYAYHIYELIYTIEIVLSKINKYYTVDKLIIMLLMYWQHYMMLIISFKINTFLRSFNKITYASQYDDIIPRLTIDLYKGQEEFAKCIYDAVCNVKNKLILYKTSIGQGKTSSVAIISYVSNIFYKNTGCRKKILYTCALKHVRLDVGQIVYNIKTRFGFCFLDKKNELFVRLQTLSLIDKKKYKDMNYCIDQADILILDVASTQALLKYLRDNNMCTDHYILFIDEHTVGVDCCSAIDDYNKDYGERSVTAMILDILRIAPPITILCSGTSPYSHNIAPVINLFTSKFKKCDVVNVNAMEDMKIGANIYDYNGRIISIFTTCRNKEHLHRAISVLNNNYNTRHYVTWELLYTIIDWFSKKGIKIIDIDKMILLNNIHHKTLIDIYIQLIENIIELDDDIINAFINHHCGVDLEEFDEHEYDEKVNNIFTINAYKYQNGCLIVTDNPLELGMYILNLLMGNKISYKKMMNDFSTACEKYVTDCAKISHSKDKNDKINKLGHMQQISEQIETITVPKVNFPHHLQINTSEHHNMYSDKDDNINVNMFTKFKPRTPLCLEKLPTNTNIPNEYMMLLCCGIAIYTASDLNEEYYDIVLQLIKNQQLAFIITDKTICFGTNFPISNIIILNNVACDLSISTIYQLINRAGRLGKSTYANIHILCNKLISRIINSFILTETLLTEREAIHLNEHVQYIDNVINSEIAKICNLAFNPPLFREEREKWFFMMKDHKEAIDNLRDRQFKKGCMQRHRHFYNFRNNVNKINARGTYLPPHRR